MSRAYKFWDQTLPYFVTFATVYWIDVFTRRCYFDCVVDSINHCIIHKGLCISAWCIMSNHVHLIMGTNDKPMQDILRDLKKYTSKELIRTIQSNPQESRKEWMIPMFERAGRKNGCNKHYQFWQQHNQPIELYNAGLAEQKLQYIHYNPVKAGFVDQPENYLYSSARTYAGMDGLVPLVLIE